MKTKPLQHQADLIRLITEPYPLTNKGIVWEMGLGKTWVGAYILEMVGIESKSLVVCPTSVMETWKREILKHSDIPEEEIIMLIGTRTQREKILNRAAQVYILNYEGLRILKESILAETFEVIILDEAHRIKNPSVQTSKVAVKLQGNHRYILTGTPILNSYMDVFNLCFFLDRGELFGDNFFVFRNFYFFDANANRFRGNFPDWKIKPHMETILKNRLKTLFHRLEKKDVMKYLPNKIYITKYCYMTPIQKKYYEEIKKDCITYIEDKAVTAKVALTKILRLNQITSGHLKTEEGDIIHITHSPKMDLLIETVEEILAENPTNKVIIWAHFRVDIDNIVKKMCTQRHKVVYIYGGLTNMLRQIAEEHFQNDPDTRILVGNPQSAGEGLTLTAANYAIYYSMNYSMKDRLQSEDRCHRKGSEIHKAITYIDLVTKDTVDEVVLRKVDKKIDLARIVMDFIKGGK